MSSPVCATDGASAAALVCAHLLKGEGLGFHYEAERDPESMECPDAWCDDCHVALEEAGEWTDELFARGDFQVVCSLCYSRVRARNWSQDDAAYEDLARNSLEYLRAQQEVLMRDFRIGEHKRWDWDLERAELVFSNDGKPSVMCSFVFVGSIERESGTWLWSWANDSMVESSTNAMIELCEFGEERGFERLAGACWEGDEADGWEVSAIAAKYLGAIGVYRAPDENGFVFMVITGARWAH